MNMYLLIGPKDWMRCPVCGDKSAPAKYRGKMSFDEKRGKMACNRCDFSFALGDLKPKPELTRAVEMMQAISDR